MIDNGGGRNALRPYTVNVIDGHTMACPYYIDVYFSDDARNVPTKEVKAEHVKYCMISRILAINFVSLL